MRDWWTAWERATLQTERTGKPHIFRADQRWKACLPREATTSAEAARAIDFCAGSSITAMPFRAAHGDPYPNPMAGLWDPETIEIMASMPVTRVDIAMVIGLLSVTLAIILAVVYL
jgi:hypothetical protein